MKKRILSMLLVIVMVLSLVPVSALADGITISGKNFLMAGETVELSFSANADEVYAKDPAVATVEWAITTNPDKCKITGGAEGGRTEIVVKSGTMEQKFPIAVYKEAGTAPVIIKADPASEKQIVDLNTPVTTLTCEYEQSDCDVFRWYSSKPAVATVQSDNKRGL